MTMTRFLSLDYPNYLFHGTYRKDNNILFIFSYKMFE